MPDLNPPEPRPPWCQWRDDNGDLHWDVPRCEAYTKGGGRFSWSYGRNGHQCTRRGVRKRVDAPGWKGCHWFCELHDPARPKAEDLQKQVRELRVALAALLPAARYGLRAAEPMAAQLGAREWQKAIRRADDLVDGE